MPLIDPGDKAPNFDLPDQNGERHRLADYAGAPLVLYFYPKDDTEGCTDEACQFRDALPRFGRIGAHVLGVSPDDERSHRRFAGKHSLSFPILADPERKTLGAYGVLKPKQMFGREYMGVVRTTYLIDGEGRIARRWDNVEVPGHAEDVLHAVEALAVGEDPSRVRPVDDKPMPRSASKKRPTGPGAARRAR